MTDLVTYQVPDEHGHALIHQESAIVPEVGERVWVDVEYNECYDFVVVSRDYRLNIHDSENKTQVVLELVECEI